MTTILYDKKKNTNVTQQDVLSLIREDLTIQHVSCSGVNDGFVCSLCGVLLENLPYTNVQSLTLTDCNLTAVAARSVATFLETNPPLRDLDLSGNNLGPDGVQVLIQPLITTNKTLRTLDVSNNGLSAKVASIASLLHHSNLQELRLGENHLGSRSVKVVAPKLKACRRLTSLSLPNADLRSRGMNLLANGLARQSSLRYLDVSCNRAGSKGTQYLSTWLLSDHTLVTLVLNSNDVGPTGATSLGTVLQWNHTLRHLHLSGNQVGNDGAAALANGLSQPTSPLLTLDLDWNQIGNAGATRLAESLTHNGALQTLNLSSNQIQNAGGIALAKALPYNGTLQHLNLSDNQLRDAAAQAFAKSLVGCNRVLQTLEYGDNPISCDAVLQNAFRYRRNYRTWFGKLLQGELPTTLNLFSKTIGDEELVALAERLAETPSRLSALYIGGNLVTYKGIAALSKSLSLTRLYVRNSCVADEGAAALALALETTSSIQVVSLTSSGISAAGAKSLGEALRWNHSLRRLNLDDNSIGDRGLQELTCLVALSVANNGITDAGILCVAHSSLQEVNLRANEITDRGVLQLAQLLHDQSDRSLRVFLQGNQITRDGREAAAQLLPPSITFEYM